MIDVSEHKFNNFFDEKTLIRSMQIADQWLNHKRWWKCFEFIDKFIWIKKLKMFTLCQTT